MLRPKNPPASVPHLLLEGPRAHMITLRPQRCGEVVHRGEGVWVLRRKNPPADVQHLFLEGSRAHMITLRPQRCGKVVH